MTFKHFSAFILGVAFVASANADDKTHNHSQGAKTSAHASSATQAPAEGVVRRVSKGSKKLTIKHGYIESLDMPAMTMEFEVPDTELLNTLKKGDEIEFQAQSVDGKFVITELKKKE